MKSWLSFFVFFSGLAILVLVSSQNAAIMGQSYIFRLDLASLHIRFMPLRVDMLLLACILLGFVWSWSLGAPHWLRRTLELRRLRKQVVSLQKELDKKNQQSSAVVSHSDTNAA